jgi:hypothetical protein
VWQVSPKQGYVEGVTLRRIFHIPADTAWSGTFVLHPEPADYPVGGRHIAVTAEVRSGSRSSDLSYNIYVWPDGFASEADFLAHVLQRVREGMEYKKNQRGDQQLRVLRVGFVEE